MNRRTCYILPMLFIMMSFIVAPISAYACDECEDYNYVVGLTHNGGTLTAIATTDNPRIVQVRFHFYKDGDSEDPLDWLTLTAIVYSGGALDTYSGVFDREIWRVKARFEIKISCCEWVYCYAKESITVPWFTSLPVVMLACVSLIGYLKKVR